MVTLSIAYKKGKVKLVNGRPERKADRSSSDDVLDNETENGKNKENVDDQTSDYSQELPGPLPLDHNDWAVLLLSVTSRREIIVRLIDNTDELDCLNREMDRFYNNDRDGKPVKRLIINRVYAAVFNGACGFADEIFAVLIG